MASDTNPYGSFLGGRDPLQVTAETPQRLTELFQKIGVNGQEKTYAPGKWTAREILCHLADCEIAFGFRLRQTLAEPDHVIQPFDQQLWAKRYAHLDGSAALSTFVALRNWNVAMLNALSPDDFTITATHPERGRMTFRTIVETLAGHDLNHLGQLETIAHKPISR
jgi:hypothetical protein